MKRDDLKQFTLFLFLLLHFTQNANSQFIRHSYRFYNNLKVSSPECGPDLQPAKSKSCSAGAVGGSFVTDQLPLCGSTRMVYHTNLYWGLGYSNDSGTVGSTYTIQLYVRTTNWGPASWTRIIDFSNG